MWKLWKLLKKNLRLSCVSPLLPSFAQFTNFFFIFYTTCSPLETIHTRARQAQKSFFFFSSSSYKNTPSPQSSNRWASKGNWIGSWGWELSEFSLFLFWLFSSLRVSLPWRLTSIIPRRFEANEVIVTLFFLSQLVWWWCCWWVFDLLLYKHHHHHHRRHFSFSCFTPI